MAYSYQVTVDSADPHTQAVWWADTLGWRLEPTDEAFIRRMIAEGQARETDTIVFQGELWWKEGAAIVHPDGPSAGVGHRILFQLVPEPKSGKARLHLDVRVGKENVASTVAALTERGARELFRGRQGPHDWITMTDPEGNEFCVT
ncbi:MAG TPA: VOC family protein [Pseudonocardiaceae bacterium]|jgi:hypothetical protein|nr:VOC family protein [Pseudonocardiaceae bacterium]